MADQPDPRLDKDGKFKLFLQRQLRGYKSLDPPVRAQPALTASILRRLYLDPLSPFDKALCELFKGSFFFAMRSCEYIQVSGTRRTKLLTLKNIRFFRKRRCIQHSDPLLQLSDCVSITFELQRRDSKNDTITQHKSSDQILCAVKVWSKIVKHLLSYNSSPATTVNTFQFPDKSIHKERATFPYSNRGDRYW